MTDTNKHPVCKTPDLCVIACPFNRVLVELGEPSCEPPLRLLEDEDNPIEIVFWDPPVVKESPQR
jgi:hypothetical protein